MAISPLAGKPAPKEILVDLVRLEREYYERRPDVGNPTLEHDGSTNNLIRRCRQLRQTIHQQARKDP